MPSIFFAIDNTECDERKLFNGIAKQFWPTKDTMNTHMRCDTMLMIGFLSFKWHHFLVQTEKAECTPKIILDYKDNANNTFRRNSLLGSRLWKAFIFKEYYGFCVCAHMQSTVTPNIAFASLLDAWEYEKVFVSILHCISSHSRLYQMPWIRFLRLVFHFVARRSTETSMREREIY